jgi:histidine triad (HIT) family protein
MLTDYLHLLNLNYLKVLFMSSIFTKIIKGEIPCYKIAEDDNFLAFLDVNPNAKGHTLCIPKLEIDKIFDIEDDLYIGLMQFSKKIAIALEKAVPCKRIGMAVIGLEVPHAHVHLIPLNEMDEMRFQKKVSLSTEEFEELTIRIKANL